MYTFIHIHIHTNKINLLHLYWHSDRLVINVEWLLQLPNLHFGFTWLLVFLVQIANRASNKGKSAVHPLLNGSEVFFAASDKAKSFAEKSNPDDSGICLPVFPSITNFKLHNLLVTLKLVKKVTNYLGLSIASGPERIPVVVLKNWGPELS